ncbi:MAG: helix-turn-helix transcriptional regulator [Eubacteriales bacterium]|nr:helix-turn-helix transcriptional regulator [Eubacteriales bacterium]
MGKRKKMTPFGKAVRKRLVDLDMNQNDLAARFGISAPHLHYILYGERSDAKWIEPICEALGIRSTRFDKGA